MTSDSTIWFHEDDYCQIELLPNSATDFARRQATEIDTFSNAHEAGDAGWTDVYVRQEPPTSLGSLGITLDDLAGQIPKPCKLFDHVTTGYSTHVVDAKQTVAWGAERGALVFANYDSSRVVQNVWFPWFEKGDVELLQSFLFACGKQWTLILADWAWNQIVDLQDEKAVTAYLTLRTAARTQ